MRVRGVCAVVSSLRSRNATGRTATWIALVTKTEESARKPARNILLPVPAEERGKYIGPRGRNALRRGTYVMRSRSHTPPVRSPEGSNGGGEIKKNGKIRDSARNSTSCLEWFARRFYYFKRLDPREDEGFTANPAGRAYGTCLEYMYTKKKTFVKKKTDTNPSETRTRLERFSTREYFLHVEPSNALE